MDTESLWVYERMKLYELMQEQPGLSNRQYARHLQHDPKWVRKWRQRFQDTPEIQVKTFFNNAVSITCKLFSFQGKNTGDVSLIFRPLLSDLFCRFT